MLVGTNASYLATNHDRNAVTQGFSFFHRMRG